MNKTTKLSINLLKSGCQYSNRRWYTPIGSHFSDNNPNTLEKEKKRLLEGKVKGFLKHAPGWNEALASDSEAYIKADREPDSPSIACLQHQTISDLFDRYNEEEVDANVTIDTDVHQKIKIHGHVHKN
ncbi:14624_t:CDS:2 [Entrophospora sp. SA101]|nr:9236_t:CDS:2 [Entrophospora sp. SA101]CAJ0643409.1 6009_t:CDS:2 [Entrophospora sp. SA101]CAJ0756663.1 21115_t:CDS:2 [Entrophospora sp. SA101]CAJ0762560.1 14624_t:CDS:2 [Entrophospora sp. SA101]CAJ0834169.1 7660_t:CDS:2 [Entrophospora sp. SA101]